MARGIKSTASAKKDTQLVKKAELAELLMKLTEEIKAEIEGDILRDITCVLPAELAALQSDYKACVKIVQKLQSKINDGSLAERRLNKEG